MKIIVKYNGIKKNIPADIDNIACKDYNTDKRKTRVNKISADLAYCSQKINGRKSIFIFRHRNTCKRGDIGISTFPSYIPIRVAFNSSINERRFII